jgi:adenine-specific DNA-methyltransferase
MEKLKLHTTDLTADNVEKIAGLFPQCVTEARGQNGQITRAVDFEQLRSEISSVVVEETAERYRLDWPGKLKSIVAANTPIAKTLRPCRAGSVDFDTTKNIFIEGDNLDALKLLQEAYLNRVKIIYMDPPYNTGNDFIYRDDFSVRANDYFLRTNQIDESGNRMVANTEANGRFHSDWLTMMYPRLKLARNLLSEDGVVFISIDDGEIANLRKLCDEIFGEDNFLGNIARATGQTTGQDGGGLGSSFDFILAYAKNAEFDLSGLPLTEKDLLRFDNTDERGNFAYDQMRKTGSNDRRSDRPNMYYPILDPDGNKVYPIAPAGYEGRWRFERKTYDRLVKEQLILWKKSKRDDGEIWWPYVKYYLEGRTKRPSPLWDDLEGNKKAARDLRAIFEGAKLFDFPKPVQMLERCIQIAPNASSGDIVLDLFAGSGSSAHATLDLNCRDSGVQRRFIMVQFPEVCAAQSEAASAGYSTIADICKERIRRVGAKLRADMALVSPDLDIGFRVLKIDTSNMEDVYYAPDEVKKDDLLAQLDNIRKDRTPEDLLFQVLVDWGLDLSLPIATETIVGKTVFFVDENALAACFDQDIDENLVKELAKRKPLRAVFRDNSYADDSVKINVEQVFKLLSPSTEIKSL